MDEYVIVEKSSLKSMADAVRTTTGSTDSIAVSALSNEVAAAVGGGLPSGGAPYQQLVTDGDGNAKWEDRLAYETKPVVTEIVPEETVAFSDSEFGKAAVWPPTFNPVEGSIYIVRIDGAEYTCPCVRFNRTLTLGNLALAGVGDDTG